MRVWKSNKNRNKKDQNTTSGYHNRMFSVIEIYGEKAQTIFGEQTV